MHPIQPSLLGLQSVVRFTQDCVLGYFQAAPSGLNEGGAGVTRSCPVQRGRKSGCALSKTFPSRAKQPTVLPPERTG